MKRILYISNIEVPYRTEFFNQLSKKVKLTVIYERKKSSNRNSEWSSSVECNFEKKYLSGVKIGNEFGFSFKILKYIFSKQNDEIIFGCYNSPIQMLSILLLNIIKRPFSINIDGDYDIEGNSIKKRLKRFILKTANKFYVAGQNNAFIYKKYFYSQIIPYNFSSLTMNEVNKNSLYRNNGEGNYIIVIGQYFDYKGLDIAVQVAKMDKDSKYKFIGMGTKSDEFREYVDSLNIENIEIIPFLKKEDLYKEYEKSKFLLLPSKKECWGLVINEAASFGCPIVSTFGCGAAKEILSNEYKIFLAESNNAKDLYDKVKFLENYEFIEKYKDYLINVSSKYTIENMVESYTKK